MQYTSAATALATMIVWIRQRLSNSRGQLRLSSYVAFDVSSEYFKARTEADGC